MDAMVREPPFVMFENVIRPPVRELLCVRREPPT